MSIRDAHIARVLSQGSTKGQRDKNSFIQAMMKDFHVSPSYFEVNINGSENLTGVQIYDNTSKEKVDTSKNLIMKPNEIINVGDSLVWNNIMWLCIQTEKFSDVYIKAVIMQVNNSLKFIDKTNTLYDIPCIVTKSTIKTDDGTYMDIQSTQIFVIIADRENAVNIKEDMRFILGKNVYKIQSSENITQKGLINIKMIQSAIVPTDNFITNIADNNLLKNNVIVEDLDVSTQSQVTVTQTIPKKKFI